MKIFWLYEILYFLTIRNILCFNYNMKKLRLLEALYALAVWKYFDFIKYMLSLHEILYVSIIRNTTCFHYNIKSFDYKKYYIR